MKDILTIFAASTQPTLDVTPNKPSTVGGGDSSDLGANVQNIINAIIGVLGIVAVVVIIYGGVQYMTSSGDSGKVKKAKDTILYGVIGLVICALAFAITNFVIGIFDAN